MQLEVLPTDTSFKYSYDAGHPNCICSRCSNKIEEHEAPIIRVFTTNEHDEVYENSKEYRYCDNCAATMEMLTARKLPQCAPILEARQK